MAKPRYSFWTVHTLGWTAYLVALTLGSLAHFHTLGEALAFKMAMVVPVYLLTGGLRYVYRSNWFAQRGTGQSIALIVVCSFAAALVWVPVLKFLRIWLFAADAPAFWLSWFSGSLPSAITIMCWSALYFGVGQNLALQAERETALAAKALANEARLTMLRYQLNPHFLFNALNSLGALIRKDPPAAEAMTDELAEFLRYTLAREQREQVPLRAEFEAIGNYLAIERIRYADKLACQVTLDPAVADFAVPAFLVHPLVENAVKYGMRSATMPLRLEIAARPLDGGGLFVRVFNSGTWAPRDDPHGPACPRTGLGLKNIRARLDAYFPGRHRFEVGAVDGGVAAVLELWP